MQLERRIVDFQLRGTSNDGSEFDGYTSCFYTIDTYGTIVDDGFFDDTLEFFLAEGFIGGLNHNWDQPIGKPVAASKDARGLLIRGAISDTAHGKDVKVLLKDGVIKKLSQGFVTKAARWLDTAEDVAAYWAEKGYTPTAEDVARSQYGARLLLKGRLYEASPVTVPANADCDITNVRGDAPAALRLDDHLLTVLAANEDLLKRLSGLAEKRGEDGRTLSAQRRSQIERLRSDADALLQRCAPNTTPQSEAPPAEQPVNEAATHSTGTRGDRSANEAAAFAAHVHFLAAQAAALGVPL